MNSTCAQPTSRPRRRAGFTLVELLISVSVLSLLVAAVASATLFLTRTTYSMTNITLMNSESRQFLDLMGQDLRAATNVTKAVARQMWLVVEDPDGNEQTVKYVYSRNKGTLTRQVVGESRITVVNNVEWMKFFYYDSQDVSTKNILDMKKIDFRIRLQTSQFGVVDSEREFRSARFVLRNRELGG